MTLNQPAGHAMEGRKKKNYDDEIVKALFHKQTYSTGKKNGLSPQWTAAAALQAKNKNSGTYAHTYTYCAHILINETRGPRWEQLAERKNNGDAGYDNVKARRRRLLQRGEMERVSGNPTLKLIFSSRHTCMRPLIPMSYILLLHCMNSTGSSPTLPPFLAPTP